MNEISEEIKAKLYEAQTLDDFMNIAGECGVDVTRKGAEKFYTGAGVAIADDQLDVVAGGNGGDEGSTSYSCGKSFQKYYAQSQSVDSGCGGSTKEYQCPYCGTWN